MSVRPSAAFTERQFPLQYIIQRWLLIKKTLVISLAPQFCSVSPPALPLLSAGGVVQWVGRPAAAGERDRQQQVLQTFPPPLKTTPSLGWLSSPSGFATFSRARRLPSAHHARDIPTPTCYFMFLFHLAAPATSARIVRGSITQNKYEPSPNPLGRLLSLLLIISNRPVAARLTWARSNDG